MIWHELRDPMDPELDRLAAQYSIHPLHIEDCRSEDQRAKIEDGVGYLFMILKTIAFNPNRDLDVHELDLFLGSDWVITVQERDQESSARILQPVDAMKDKLRADQVFYRILDGVVDSYLPVLDSIDDLIDELEEGALKDASPDFLSRIFASKRNLIELRRVLVNTRDVVGHLYRTEHQLIDPDLHPFFQDVYDHVARNLDMLETQRDLVSATMDVYLSSVANRTNQVMKVLTILGTVALPILVISGYYGMNTKNLPLADWPNATLIVSLMMAGSTVILLLLLRWFKWF